MSIKIEIPLIMQKMSGGHEVVEVKGKTVGECLDDFIRQYPVAKEWFQPHNPIVWLVLNQNIVNFDQLNTPVSDGDDISLIMVIGGG